MKIKLKTILILENFFHGKICVASIDKFVFTINSGSQADVSSTSSVCARLLEQKRDLKTGRKIFTETSILIEVRIEL